VSLGKLHPLLPSSSNRERDVRAKFLQQGLVEAVILLPENLFYNTSAPGIILVINKARPALSEAQGPRAGEILLINASHHFEKGRPKNYLTDEHIAEIAAVYLEWGEVEELSATVSEEEVARSDYNLSPRRYVVIDDVEPVLPLEEALVLLAQAEEARAEADAALEEVLTQLGFEGWRRT
jgi:type I restriction enzyme M protein